MVRSRTRVMVVLTLASLAGGCPESSPVCARNSDCEAGNYCSGGTCISDCTPATEGVDCASGESCNTFGMCVAPPDAGARDAGPPRADGGADSPDSRPPCVIAGGTDADGDGFCATGADADCNDADDAVSPGADEVCTPSVTGSVPADENCDRGIDEGCGWFFGRPHPVMAAVQPVSAGYPAAFGTFLDSEGTHLYIAQSSGTGQAATFVISRSNTGLPFGGIAPVPFADTTMRTYEIAMEPGALRGIVQAILAGAPASDLFAIERADLGAPFTVRRLDALSTAEFDINPTMSADGLELFFLSGATVRRATRASRTVDFSSPTPVTGLPTSGIAGLSLSDDGADLFFHRAAGTVSRVFRAHRSDLGGVAFEAPVEVTALDATGADELAYPHVSLRTRELFFTSSNRAFGPASRSLWRVQICRDGPCEEPLIDCPSGGRRSDDGFHCYSLTSTAGPWGNASAACLPGVVVPTERQHLASIHSEAERALLWSGFGSAVQLWVGGTDMTAEGAFVWDSGEPWTFAPRAAPWGQCCGGLLQPDDSLSREDCTVLEVGMTSIPGATGMGFMNDGDCSARSHLGVCEREVWPTW